MIQALSNGRAVSIHEAKASTKDRFSRKGENNLAVIFLCILAVRGSMLN